MPRKAKSKIERLEDKKAKMIELDNRMNKLKSEFNDLNFQAELERFKNLECVSCSKSLKLSDEEIKTLMKEGITAIQVTCPECSMVNRIISKYNDDPEVGTSIIKLEEIGYSFNVHRVSNLSKEELKKRLEMEIELIDNAKSKKTQEIQLIYKLINELI